MHSNASHDRKGPALRVCELRTDRLYLSPSGKLCRLLPQSERGYGSGGDSFGFEYLGAEGEGFRLRAGNVWMMREAAR